MKRPNPSSQSSDVKRENPSTTISRVWRLVEEVSLQSDPRPLPINSGVNLNVEFKLLDKMPELVLLKVLEVLSM